MSLVLDASATLSWYFTDEHTPDTKTLIDQVVEQGAVVPALWRIEVANSLQMSMRRGRIDPAFRDHALIHLARMNITVDDETDTYIWNTTLHLSDRFKLTLYDAVYLELAQRRHLPLATLDRPLRQAATTLQLEWTGASA